MGNSDMNSKTLDQSPNEKAPFFDREIAIAIAAAYGELPRSPSLLLTVGAVMYLVLGHDAGIIDDLNYITLKIILIFIASYWLSVFLVNKLFRSQSFEGKGIATAHGIYSEIEDASDTAIQQRANHEAGHVVALAYFPERPDSLEAWITKNNQPGVGGRVSYKYDEPTESTVEHLKALRLFCVLPLMVEEVILGKSRAGSDSDIRNWESTVKTQLNNFPDSREWFRVQNSEFEATINARTLKQLLDEDLRISRCNVPLYFGGLIPTYLR